MRALNPYPSKLITVSTGMYTKHYYAGSSRIASRIGGGFVPHKDLNDYSPVATADRVPLLQTSSYDHKAENLRNLWARAGECMGVSLEYAYSLESSGLYLNPTETADGERYFYHSDHLGSSAFVTTENGYATQFLAYMPYGETLAEQQNGTSYYSPFKFSAKEKDPETGYSYFGARYYSPELSVWLSVDPMSDKYPSLSSYNYCALNPVILVDPDGREITFGWFDFKAKSTYKKVYDAADAETKAKYDELAASDIEYRIKSDGTLKQNTGRNSQLNYNFKKERIELTFDRGINNPVGALGDELEHASQFENGQLGFVEGGLSLGYDMMDEIASIRAGIAATDNVNRMGNNNFANDQSIETFKKFDAFGRPQDWFTLGQPGYDYMKLFGPGGTKFGNHLPANMNYSYSQIARILGDSKFIYREQSQGKMVTRTR